jgi:hypothetical protein
VFCWLTDAAAPVIAVGQVVGGTLAASASRFFRFVPDGTYSTYYISSSISAACTSITLFTQHASPPSANSFLASSSNVSFSISVFRSNRFQRSLWNPHNSASSFPYFFHFISNSSSLRASPCLHLGLLTMSPPRTP